MEAYRMMIEDKFSTQRYVTVYARSQKAALDMTRLEATERIMRCELISLFKELYGYNQKRLSQKSHYLC